MRGLIPEPLPSADLLIRNGRVITFDRRAAGAGAVAIRGDRILAVGRSGELDALRAPHTEVVDARGGLIAPAFHDAHFHFLSYARLRSRVDCRGLRSIEAIKRAVADRARTLAPGVWVRAAAYDETLLADGRHVDRRDLDLAAPDHPVRLQHRTLHLDVLNTAALRRLRLLDEAAPEVERAPDTGEATGRIFHGGALLRSRRAAARVTGELAEDVAAACTELLRLGITTVQDATYTNGPDEWSTFRALAASGHLGVRLVMFQGTRAIAEGWGPDPVESDGRLLIGPAKVMLAEGHTDEQEALEAVAQARRAGLAVALHAVSEAEVAIALFALARAPERARGRNVPASARGPDRIEHGAVIPDAFLPELRAGRVTVVGQPSLVYTRGDRYASDYAQDVHGWLHRARSVAAGGIGYAVGSDAPVSDPWPALSLFAARRRTTENGYVLGAAEGLTRRQALAAHTAWPARAIGLASDLGALRPGALADLVVLDPDLIDASAPPAMPDATWLTVSAGRVVWRPF